MIDNCSSQRGFTLLETLVALIILTIGIISLIGLQSASLRLNQKNQLANVAKDILTSEIDKILPLSNLQLRETTNTGASNFVGQQTSIAALGSPFTDPPFSSTANPITVDTSVPTNFDYVRWSGIKRSLLADEQGAFGKTFPFLVKIAIDEKYLLQDILARGRITVYWPSAKRGVDFIETTFYTQRK
jgi:prepilin-type N-terminal cleavage/methylation domain-containing protein